MRSAQEVKPMSGVLKRSLDAVLPWQMEMPLMPENAVYSDSARNRHSCSELWTALSNPSSHWLGVDSDQC